MACGREQKTWAVAVSAATKEMIVAVHAPKTSEKPRSWNAEVLRAKQIETRCLRTLERQS